MGTGFRADIVMALAWLVFPLIPVVLEELYYQVVVNYFGNLRSGPDPGDWGWGTWVMMLGPLVGYGFLAGATAEVPDEVSGPKRGVSRIVARRAVWVAAGAWAGFFLIGAIFLNCVWFSSLVPPMPTLVVPGPSEDSWASTVIGWIWTVLLLAIFAYGWLWPAWAALRRAGRIGLWRRAMYRGVVTAIAFVGSLFGSFWAITSAWRSFYFDPRVMPMIAVGISLVALSGCASTITYGEMRRRELFHAMLPAWVFGLAIIWWWSSRRRRGGKRQNRPDTGSREGPMPSDS